MTDFFLRYSHTTLKALTTKIPEGQENHII